MGSAHANRFNTMARPILWAAHSEIVGLRVTDGNGNFVSRNIPAIFRRIQPETPSEDGLGVTTTTGNATLVVKLADVPTDPGPSALITRSNGEAWAVNHIEHLDDYADIWHLGRPDAENRMPARMRP